MEDQVPSSNIPQEQGNYYQTPEGPRFQNPAQFSTASQQEQAPATPDFQEMRRIALEQAIQQVTQQPLPQQAPPGMELSMDGSQYVPQKYPTASVAQPTSQAQQYSQPETNTIYVRRNLTLAELLVVFALASGLVLGVQGIWSFATDFLPRIEIREK